MLGSPGSRVEFRPTVVGCRTSQSALELPKSLAILENSSAFDPRRLFAYVMPQGCCNTESVHKHDLAPPTMFCTALVTRRHRGVSDGSGAIS